ncbi:TetR/AcrR family transcriptional regulator [Streptomyces sp. ISL-66]|uniref:TetR/AcrR family transcriptional regulator n=1 Tax=Streptomyces sp. ISL-66 TaxID=2819186 RepID=UPI001BE8CAC3|nr:TetR/AcrR family transcriptional regulator [Streptomyces sp. ISL-66]MBT2468463.1 TetR/AcrR family transcriptional regulator [Streptomyces sp. ISL-66]
MPTARESLLEAAGAALSARPWPAVRMVDVAASAGVSRQTLYNEFAGKTGLGHALVRRDAAWYLDGVERALTSPGGRAERLVAVAEWTVRASQARPLVRALLTGCWNGNLPVPAGRGVRPGLPALGPGELVRSVRERASAAFAPGEDRARERGRAQEQGEWAQRCELAVRLAMSYLLAPAEAPGRPGPAELLRLFNAPNPKAEDR